MGKQTLLTNKIGKGPPPEGMTVERWRKHGQNLRRLERLTGIAPIAVEGWEMATVILMNMLEEAMLANDCLAMIRECFVSMGMDIAGTPPMNYPEAMQALLFTRLKESGAFPGHEATVRYEATDKPNHFNRVEL